MRRIKSVAAVTFSARHTWALPGKHGRLPKSRKAKTRTVNASLVGCFDLCYLSRLSETVAPPWEWSRTLGEVAYHGVGSSELVTGSQRVAWGGRPGGIF